MCLSGRLSASLSRRAQEPWSSLRLQTGRGWSRTLLSEESASQGRRLVTGLVTQGPSEHTASSRLKVTMDQVKQSIQKNLVCCQEFCPEDIFPCCPVSVILMLFIPYSWDFLGGSSGKELACQCRRHKRHRFDPWLSRSPREGTGKSPQYTCLENLMNCIKR